MYCNGETGVVAALLGEGGGDCEDCGDCGDCGSEACVCSEGIRACSVITICPLSKADVKSRETTINLWFLLLNLHRVCTVNAPELRLCCLRGRQA
jgi:hypothetical protein